MKHDNMINLPEGETLNGLFLKKGSAAIETLLQQGLIEEVEPVRRDVLPLPLSEVMAVPRPEPVIKQQELPLAEPSETGRALKVIHDQKMLYASAYHNYYVLGRLDQELSSLRVTLLIENPESGYRERVKLDLYEQEMVRHITSRIASAMWSDDETIAGELAQLTELLETHRDSQTIALQEEERPRRSIPSITIDKQKKCLALLQHPDLMNQLNVLVGKAGVVGEEKTRLLLFVLASTYKMTTPLHALVQGSSGSGKSHLINLIGGCLPPEDVLSMTRVTSKSFYHYGKDELVDKLILIQDYDGLDEEAQYAFRELQSAGMVSSSTTYKDRNGNLISTVKTVKSHFASLLATTHAEIYFDNMNRCLVLGVDESEEQTQRIIRYQNQKLAGQIDTKAEQDTKKFLQDCVRLLKPYEVVNRYADKVSLPIEAKMLRRLNSHYQAFVKQITILHQHQRQVDAQGRLVAQPEDLKMACDILFDAIMLKVDDLDSSLRQFFDLMKAFIKEQAGEESATHQFTQRDVRLTLKVSKTQCFRYMEDLELLEYVQKTGGYANRGFKYKIVYWDDMEKIRTKIKADLNKQLEGLK